MTLDIRPMRRIDLDIALGWARDEGWNPGLDDADALYAQDPSGFLMGWLGTTPIGCVSVVKYGTDFAFLGLYIVHPEWRGRAYGKAIWDAGIASAGSRTIGLDGVVAQQDNYRKSGFALAHRSARWGGIVKGSEITDPRVRRLTPDLMPTIAVFDRLCFPEVRPRFLNAWLDAPSSTRRSLCAIENDDVIGYGTVRRGIEGHKVGPLFARSPEVANVLFSALAADIGPSPIFVDIPATNDAAVRLAENHGLTPSFETARMYRGPAPTITIGRVFGITTLELG
ncbi:MAG: GNAT family N-acetyltransferase [Devosia sp.]